MYTVASPYDSFFYYANRPVPHYSYSFATPPVAPLKAIARYRHELSLKSPERKKAANEKETLAAQIEAEITGKGRWFNEYI
ncbi:hypothetical protein [Anoxybacteroides tepidamans]|uniref:hypothetical protein n=1 Tax=Anoxybacteroides tepidamans TaxID=265948 RepID=UPI000480204D|nr:hypothetical protein [Anoxybacillus tepidamans]